MAEPTGLDGSVGRRRADHPLGTAVNVFRASLDILEMIKESHREVVKSFAQEALKAWVPFFTDVMKRPLPAVPREEEEETNEGGSAEYWRGLTALKIQGIKTLMKIRAVFPALLAPQSSPLFTAAWQELASVREAYFQLYINDQRQNRLVDADGLPYTLDFLVVEELDFVQACLRAPPVRAHLGADLQFRHGVPSGQPAWLDDMVKLAVAYAEITTEEEALWEMDVNLFLSEETSVTANYTPRIACGDLLIKLSEWVRMLAVERLLAYTQTVCSNPSR